MNAETKKGPDLQEVGGSKKHNKKNSPKNTIVVGKVYANWCGHCKNLKPEWVRMKSHIQRKKGKTHIVYAEIEENEIDTKLKTLQDTNKTQIAVNGYPTLFRIVNGKVEYYNGNREANQMADWYLSGGSNKEPEIMSELVPPMPALMKDMQGGRRNFTRNRNKHNSRHHNFTNTRRRRTSKKTSGIFDFLFGK